MMERSFTEALDYGLSEKMGPGQAQKTMKDMQGRRRELMAGHASWIEDEQSRSYGFRFERPTTLGYGGDMCCFWFIGAPGIK